MYDVVCIGGATQDVFVRSDLSKILNLRNLMTEEKYLAFDYGAKINVDDVIFMTGGGGTNTAVALSRLGLKSTFLGKLGEDEDGEKIVQELKEEGVSTDLVVKSKRHRTGYSVILTSFEGDRTILTYRGANNYLEEKDIHWDKLAQSEWFLILSLTGTSNLTLEKMVEFAHINEIKIALNPGATQIRQRGLDGLKHVLAVTSILFLNKEEATTLTGIQPSLWMIDENKCIGSETCVAVCPQKLFVRRGGKTIITHQERCLRCELCVINCPTRAILIEPWAEFQDPLLKRLRAYGPKIVVVTDGNKGVQVYDGKYRYLMPPYAVSVASTLGAGDAFSSGFLAGFIKKNDLEYAIKAGSANAASVITTFGAKKGLLKAEEIDGFIKKHEDETTKVRKETI